ncbi:helix-turn-helix domain-containing protein [Streptomyces ficellus]|uniref:Helix-turn-helix domain-containing protein n=1 Tax=Streptomyces ficellus TaxID=1977088 RepID=A0ABT7Z8J6_9ACTN|nr:helix-turn-helix domain-containing protein [Streptomyces ficellus]MDN3295818.1 helix-turn-helix domain-containing protein [Streptomyces ficellus]
MSRWKELPAALDDSDRQLLIQLRRLKDRSGLSLAGLASKTGYSRSSWERYLNGKQPVPREAVEELARVCGTDATRLVVLHQVATRTRKAGEPGEQGEPAPSAPSTSPGPRRPRPARTLPMRRTLAAAAAAVAVSFGAGLITAGAWDDDIPVTTAGTQAATTGYLRGQTYRCDIHRENGELRAGHSETREMLLDINSTGFDVVEAQCLLREHGFDPKASDGLYDERTKAATKAFQAKRGLVVDGIIGPDTWGELRR